MPSDHVTVFWSLALATLGTRRFAAWGFTLLIAGLLVGWSRIYLGVHFPYDVAAALPVAALGALASRLLQAPLRPIMTRILYAHDEFLGRVGIKGLTERQDGARKTQESRDAQDGRI